MKTMGPDELEPDPPLTAQQRERVAQLTDKDLALIDQTLLGNASVQWRKMARVVGGSMFCLDPRIVGIPDLFYAERVIRLIDEGVLESQGDIRRMRFC
jgi:hypothetical protein